ncbi:hypothetical protein BGX23_007779 [Mortierella sp. AD031]|nr:hypothetical protein BGX23_007779 [Mortierella sp. AD031]
MDNNKKRPQIRRADSNVQSEASNDTSRSTPLRAAVARPENQEFNIAGQDFGGLPLDKAVKESIKSGKKAPEPVNEAQENLAHHVDVELELPTQTVFSSMGGGRNAPPTEIGPSHEKPKEFVYRDEGFPAPSRIANAKDSPHGTNAAPYLGLAHSFYRKGHLDKKDDVPSTPEMNLGSLFPEESSVMPKKTASSSTHTSISQQHHPSHHHHHHHHHQAHSKKRSSGIDTPAMNLDNLFREYSSTSKAPNSAQHASHHDPFNASVHLVRPMAHHPAPLKNNLARQDTPEMNLGSLFSESARSSGPSKLSQKSQQRFGPLSVGLKRQDTPEMHLNDLFPDDTAASSHHAPVHEPYNASAPLLHSEKQQHGPLKHSITRQDTSEMNLGSLFTENAPSSDSNHYRKSRQRFVPLSVGIKRQDIPEARLEKLFPRKNQSLSHKLARQGTPDMHLNDLFDESSSSSSSRPSQQSQKPQQRFAPLSVGIKRPDTPEMRLNDLFTESMASASSQHALDHKTFNAPAHLLYKVNKHNAPLKHNITRQDTLEMNLGSLFPESSPSTRPSQQSQKPQQRFAPLSVGLKRQDTPEMNLGTLFPESSSSSKPNQTQAPQQRFASLFVGLQRQDTPEMHLNDLFAETSTSSSQPKSLRTYAFGRLSPVRRSNEPTISTGQQRQRNLPTTMAELLPEEPPEEESHTQHINVSHGIAQLGVTAGDSNRPISISLEDLLNDEDASDHSPYDSPLSLQPTPANTMEFFTQPSSQDPTPAEAYPEASSTTASIPQMPSHHALTLATASALLMPSIGRTTLGTAAAKKKFHKANKLSKRNRKAHKKEEIRKHASLLLFAEPSDFALHASGASRLGGIRNMLHSMSSLHMLAMPALALPHLPKLGATSDHDIATATPHVHKHISSKAAALKMPRIDPNLLPEEQANYPRGDLSKHENPAPVHVKNMLEAMEVQLPQSHLRSISAFGTAIDAHHLHKHPPSKAATLKTLKEQASYPRGDSSRRENPTPAQIEDIIEIKMIPSLPSYIRRHPVPMFRADVPVAERKPGKRERKALRKHEATRRHSVIDTISTALVGRKKNSVSSPVMRLNELFDEPSDLVLPVAVGVAGSIPRLGGIRSMLPSLPSVHMPSMPAVPTVHMPTMTALVLPHLPKLGVTSAHDTAVVAPQLHRHVPSKAVALKMPKIDPTLLPEEKVNYPRGDSSRRENPLPSHVENILEVKEVKLPETHRRSASTFDAAVAAPHFLKHQPSKAAALKMPKVDLSLLPEEQASYPRGDLYKQENPLPSHVEDILEVKEVHYTPPEHSKAVALKAPKVNLSLLPEKQANYPRGDMSRHENPAPAHVEDIVEVKEVHVPAPLPLDAELPVAADAAPVLPVIHMPTPPTVHLSAIHMPALPTLHMPTMPSLHMPSLPKASALIATASVPDVKGKFVPGEHHSRGMEIQRVLDEEENYYSADDEPAAPITPRKKVEPISILSPAHIAAAAASVPIVVAATVARKVVPVVETPVVTRTTTVVTEPISCVIPKAGPAVEVKRIPIAQPPVQVKRTTVVIEPPVPRVIPKVAAVAVPVIETMTIRTAVTEPAREIPKVIPIAQPSVEVKRIPIAQPPVVTKTTVNTTTTTPAVPKIEVAKSPIQEVPKKVVVEHQQPVLTEVKVVKVVAAPKPEPNVSVRKPSPAEIYANEHRAHPIIVTETKVDDRKLMDMIAHTPRPVIPVMVETKKQKDVVMEAPVVVNAVPKVVEVKTTRTVERHRYAPKPEIHVDTVKTAAFTTTKTTVTTTAHKADPVPAPRPVVAAVAVAAPTAAIFHHENHHKKPAPVQMEQTTKTTKTTVVEPLIQQQQQQTTIHQQSAAATTPVATPFDSGERTLLVKKLYTTVEYYDSEDEDELDEFGYRKDRDVSLHMLPMPSAETRRSSMDTYTAHKNSRVSRLDAEIAALRHQEALDNAAVSGGGVMEPLKQQHLHFYEQTRQVYQNPNAQAYVMQIPHNSAEQQQADQYHHHQQQHRQYVQQQQPPPTQRVHQQQYVQQQPAQHVQQKQEYYQQQPAQSVQHKQHVQQQTTQQQQYHHQ